MIVDDRMNKTTKIFNDDCIEGNSKLISYHFISIVTKLITDQLQSIQFRLVLIKPIITQSMLVINQLVFIRSIPPISKGHPQCIKPIHGFHLVILILIGQHQLESKIIQSPSTR